jgi:Arc/MetJ family transcription regulator
MCLKRRLLPKGVCGETVKRQTVEKELDDDFLAESIRLRGKALRKLGEKEIY